MAWAMIAILLSLAGIIAALRWAGNGDWDKN